MLKLTFGGSSFSVKAISNQLWWFSMEVKGRMSKKTVQAPRRSRQRNLVFNITDPLLDHRAMCIYSLNQWSRRLHKLLMVK